MSNKVQIGGAVAGFLALALVLFVLVGGDNQSIQPDNLSGPTRQEQINVSWFQVGDKFSSTTSPIYGFRGYNKITGTEGSEIFTNTQLDTNGNGMDLVITGIQSHFASNASTTFRYRIATTTDATLTVADKDTEELADCSLLKFTFATSTGANSLLRSTTTLISTSGASCWRQGPTGIQGGVAGVYLKYGHSIMFQMIPGSALENDVDACRSTAGAGADCESATSSNSGLKPITNFIEGYATGTPSVPLTDIR